MPVLSDYTPDLTLYACPLSPDGTQAWNGSAFVTDSNAARNAGAIEGDEDPSGTYTFAWPAGITTPGVYPLPVYNQLGVSPNVATDEEVASSAYSTYTVSAGDVTYPTATYTPAAVWSGTRQTVRVYRGQGVPIRFAPATPTPIDEDEYEATLGVIGSDTFVTYSVALGNMSVDESTGNIDVNPTEDQTAALSLTEPSVIDLWRTSSDDVRTVVGRAYLVVVESNNP